MKKHLALILAGVMAFSVAACGKGTDESSAKPSEEGSKVTSSAEKPAQNGGEIAVNPVETLFRPSTSSAVGAYATIKVSADVKMDDESAWLGLCPTGKDYITELEADEVDVIWYNYEAREEGDPYVFACDFESVEDGTYALVVATSDDENVGYVVIQLEMTKKGEELSFDYTNAKLKERPAK